MRRVIVDYAKLTNEILNLLVEKFPEGYDDSNIVRFRNAKNELIEAVEVRTDDTNYLVKVSTKLADRIENYDEDEENDDVIEPLIASKPLGMDDDMNEDEDDNSDDDDHRDKPDVDDEDDEDPDKSDYSDDDDEDED
jgi:DNA-directed RNA polymerase subunit delta